MITIETALTLAAFYVMAILAIRLGFKACELLYHAIATLVAWPLL